ncbi:PepSY domain-containing protein [Pseudoalteromonas ostreae]|uniref:PepSY domain-containing protein n=1 Tax=Pseudoalteromonas ostreae TaxID=2774154 RepID=UPI001B36A979|nr:PepSY domain-containing protein [Pseudoalteromonas ostreae]
MRTVLALSVAITVLFSSIFSVSSLAASQVNKAEINKKQAVELAKKVEDGKTLKITEFNDIYTVRILKSDGHVVDVHVHKKTGEVKKD